MTQHAPSPITDALRAAYLRDGAVRVPGALEIAWIDRLRDAIELARGRPGPFAQDHTVPGETSGYFSDVQIAHRVEQFADFALRSPVGAIAADLMGSKHINVLHDALWIKEPGTSRRTPWHHDQPFYCMEGEKMCVVWIPVDAHPHDISLAFLRGSHRWGKRFRPERVNGGWYDGYDNDDTFETPPDVAGQPDQYEQLAWDMTPGDCLVFHGLTLHGAPGNHAATPRRAISLVLVGDDAVYVERDQETQPTYEGNGLRPGDPIDASTYFPRIYPHI